MTIRRSGEAGEPTKPHPLISHLSGASSGRPAGQPLCPAVITVSEEILPPGSESPHRQRVTHVERPHAGWAGEAGPAQKLAETLSMGKSMRGLLGAHLPWALTARGADPAPPAPLRFSPHPTKQALPPAKEDQRGSHLPAAYAPSGADTGSHLGCSAWPRPSGETPVFESECSWTHACPQ